MVPAPGASKVIIGHFVCACDCRHPVDTKHRNKINIVMRICLIDSLLKLNLRCFRQPAAQSASGRPLAERSKQAITGRKRLARDAAPAYTSPQHALRGKVEQSEGYASFSLSSWRLTQNFAGVIIRLLRRSDLACL